VRPRPRLAPEAIFLLVVILLILAALAAGVWLRS